MEFIDLAEQYKRNKKSIDSRIASVLAHGRYISGPEVQELEEKLSDYVGVAHTITCGNGTDALSLALMALEIGENDAVFCPTFTFFATAEAVALQGATPVFVDSDAQVFNICPVDLERRIEAVLAEDKLRPAAILAVDLFGLPADYSALRKLAFKYNLKIIEDAAQGFGGSINGERAGSFGDIATTSFFPAKPLGCYGDGGAVFTNDASLADLIRSYAVHGKGVDKYDNVRIGLNSRLDTIQAAILLAKLESFPQELVNRNHAALRYDLAYGDRFSTPKIPAGYFSSRAQYTLVSEKRDVAMLEFERQGIPTMIYYRKCMHQQSAFKALGHQAGDFPVAEKLAETVFSLPMHGYL
jgi:dTDP-4-amino-4,6-dideoxygalactose transaminase